MREGCAWIARKMTEWPSKRGPISKIMSSDGCKGDTVPLEMGPGYDFHEVGCHLGNVGLDKQPDLDLAMLVLTAVERLVKSL